MRHSCVLASLLVTLVHVTTASAQSAAEAFMWSPWVEFGGFATKDRARSEGTLWAPVLQRDKRLLFIDLKGKLFDDDQREGNVALGYRQMLSHDWNIGAWTGFDRRSTGLGAVFNQLALGIEAVHSAIEFRANGYVPTTRSHVVGYSQDTSSVLSTSSSTASSVQSTDSVMAPTAELTGSQLQLVSGTTTTTATTSVTTTTTTLTRTTTSAELRALALWGIDAEIGVRIPLSSASAATLSGQDKHELRFYVGAYRFDHNEISQPVVGPKLRLDWRINDILPDWHGSRLTFEAGYQWDPLRDHQGEVGLRLRLPLQPEGKDYARSQTDQARRMSEALRRDTDIVGGSAVRSASSSATTASASTTTAVTTTTSSTTTREAVQDAQTNVRFDRVATAANGSNLQSAVTTAGANSLIIAQGGATNFGRVNLVDSQTLLGGGGTIQVKGVTSGRTANFTATGTRPTINHSGPADVVTVASNAHLNNLSITGAGFPGQSNNNGVFGDTGLSNVVIANIAISNVQGSGISFRDNNSNIRISNISIDNVTQGITFQGGNSNITINGVAVNNTTFDGIIFQSNNSNIKVTDNRISNIGDDAIGGMGGNQIDYSRNTFSGSIAQNLLDIFSTNGNTYTGTGNILASGLTIGGRLCESSPGPTFTGSISFTDGTVFRDNVAPCN